MVRLPHSRTQRDSAFAKAPADRRSLVRLRAKRYGATATKLEERSRGGGWSTGLAEAFGGREGFSSSASHLDHIESGPCFAKPSGWTCFNSFQLRRKENERTG
jgi:hypothetical protein